MKAVRVQTSKKDPKVRRGSMAAPIMRQSIQIAQSSIQVWSRRELMEEIDAIWSSVTKPAERTERMSAVATSRSTAQQTMQAFIKAYYLHKTGRSKFIESSTIQLCNAVMEHGSGNSQIALFGIMSDIEAPGSMGDRIPCIRCELAEDVLLEFDPDTLTNLPLDAPQTVAGFMRALGISRVKQSIQDGVLFASTDSDEGSDEMVPLQLVLAAGRTMLCNRSRATARFFEMSVHAFTEFPTISSYRASMSSASGAQTEVARKPPAAIGWLAGLDEVQLTEVVFVSHLFQAHVRERFRDKMLDEGIDLGEEPDASSLIAFEREIVEELWNKTTSDCSVMGGIRRTLGLLPSEASCPASKVGQSLVKLGVLHVPSAMVARALLACSASKHKQQDTSEPEVHMNALARLFAAWRNQGGHDGAMCQESLALWAVLWTLAHERNHELDQMAKLYKLFDISGDGSLQLDEFTELMSSIHPHLSPSDLEEFFLCGVEDVDGDMTKEALLNLISKLGMSSDIDLLEDLVAQKRLALFGERSETIGELSL